MNDKDLRYFCKLVETASYTEAAQQLNVTQPTISTAVKRLTAKYQGPLIIQKNRKSTLKLTPAGKILYDKAKILLQAISQIERDVKHANEKKIRIAFSGVAGSIYMPDIVKQFYQAGIASMLETKFERSAAAFKSLERGEVDVAIYSWLVPINDSNYYLRNLDRSELVIITSPDHPLAKKDTISAAELKGENFIARDISYLTRESLTKIAQAAHFKPNIIYTARTMQLLIDLVESRMGIALVIESSIRNNAQVHVIRLKPEQRVYAYMQIAMRKSFMPNQYQKKGIHILRHFHQ